MANQNRGEVDMVVGDTSYRLRFATNEICEIEDLLDSGINEILALLRDPAKVKLGTWRALLWGALRGGQPGLTLLAAGEVINHATLPVVIEHVVKAMQAASPDDEGNPPRQAA